MSELTKEKVYKKELIKAGGEGNNNLERIRSLAGGGSGIEYVEINSTQGTITQDQATKLQNGAYVKYQDAVLIPMGAYAYYHLVIDKGSINMRIITFDISNLTFRYTLYALAEI